MTSLSCSREVSQRRSPKRQLSHCGRSTGECVHQQGGGAVPVPSSGSCDDVHRGTSRGWCVMPRRIVIVKRSDTAAVAWGTSALGEVMAHNELQLQERMKT